MECEKLKRMFLIKIPETKYSIFFCLLHQASTISLNVINRVDWNFERLTYLVEKSNESKENTV